MSLIQAKLDNSLAVLSNGMRLDAGKIKFESILEYGNGVYGNADGQISCYYGRMCIDNDGNLYVSDRNSGRIQKFNNTGSFQAKITGLNQPLNAIDIDLTNSKLYHHSYGNKKIYRVNFDLTSDIESGVLAGNPRYITVLGTKVYFSYYNSKNIYSLPLDLSGTETLEYSGTYIVQGLGNDGTYIYINNSNYLEKFDSSFVSQWTTGNIISSIDYERNGYLIVSGRSYSIGTDGIYIYRCAELEGKIEQFLCSDGAWQKTIIYGGTKKGQYKRVGGGAVTMNNIVLSTKYFYYQLGTYGINRLNKLLTQQAIFPYTATADGNLKGFNISGKNTSQCTYEYRINSGSWISYDETSYIPLSVSISLGDTIELRAYGGDFEETEKGTMELSDPYIQINYDDIVLDTPILDSATVTSTTIALNWNDIVGATRYKIQHSLAPYSTLTTIASATVSNYTITYTNPDDYQIGHYYRVIAYNANGYSQPSNMVSAYPNKQGQENIYKYIVQQLKSILQNDSRLSVVNHWQDVPPDMATTKAKITGWVYYTGEVSNQWVCLGEKELVIGIEIGYYIKELARNRQLDTNDVTERKDLLFNTKEILYELGKRSLYDYCYDIQIKDEVPLVKDGNGSRTLILVHFKKRIRR